MNKQISTIIGILIVVFVAGMVVASVLFFNQEIKEIVLLEEEGIESDEEIVEFDEESKKMTIDEKENAMSEAEEILMDFLEYMYITGNYEKAAKLYVHHDMTEESKIENLEWTASSMGVGRLGYDVERVEIVNREKISENEIRFEFRLIRENGQVVPLGPCCGDFETPTWYTHFYFVNKNNGEYNVYGDLLYIP